MSYVHIENKTAVSGIHETHQLRNLSERDLRTLAYQEYKNLTPIGKELYNRFFKEVKHY